MLSVWGWAASAWHLARWLRLYFRSARLTSDQVPGRNEPSLSAATLSTSGLLGSAATEASGLDSAGDAATLSPCSVESDSWDASTALSWDMEAEEDEALDPARLGASPSDALVRGHLDFGCWDGAMDTPAAVFFGDPGSAVVPFRNATGEPLSLAVELLRSARAVSEALRWRAVWEERRQQVEVWGALGEAFDPYSEVPEPGPPGVRLEPASGHLGPGEEGRLTLHLDEDTWAPGEDTSDYVELRSRAGEEERLVEIPLVMARHIFPIVRMPPLLLPHSQRPHIPFTVRSMIHGQALWVRFGRCAEAEVLGAGTWFLVNNDELRASLRLLSPGSRGEVDVRLGEAVEASPDHIEELAGLEGEELASRTQDLANLAFHYRSPEAPSASLNATLPLIQASALGTEPETEVEVGRPPSSSAVHLRNRSGRHSLVWAGEAPRGLLCEPAAGVLGPGAEAELHLSAGARPESEEEGSGEAGGGRLLIRSGYLPPEEREAVAEAPGDFVRQEHRLFPHHLHTTSLALIRYDHCSIS